MKVAPPKPRTIEDRRFKLLPFLLITLVLAGNVLLAYQPHVSQPYPLLGDEYVHLSFARQLLEERTLPFTNPYFVFSAPHANFESGFHILLAGLIAITPGDPVTSYKFFVILFSVINSLLVFVFVRRVTNDTPAALGAMFFFGTIKSASGLLAHQYFLPLTVGITLLLLLHLVLANLLESHQKKHLWRLCILLAITALTYPPTLFFFLGTTLLYILSTDHALHTAFGVSRKRFFFLSAIISCAGVGVFVGALVLFGAIGRGIFAASWDVMQTRPSPIFFFGVLPSICAAIGLLAIVAKRQSAGRILIYWLLFSLAAIYGFYLLNVSVLVPFPRLFLFYLIGVSMLAGIGVATLARRVRSLVPRRSGVYIVYVLIGAVAMFHYASVWARPLMHHEIVTAPVYDALHFLDEQYTGRSVVIADGITSLGVYPVSGRKIVNLLDANVGGGNARAAQEFLGGTCDDKRTALYFMREFLGDAEERGDVFVLSGNAQPCPYFIPLFADGMYVYHVAPPFVTASTIGDRPLTRALMPNPPQDFVLPDRELLMGESLRSLIAGHTLEADTWTEYYTPDGTIYGEERPNAVKYYGVWEVTDNFYCFYFSYANANSQCLSVAREGNDLIFFDKDGAVSSRATLQEGDLRGLFSAG